MGIGTSLFLIALGAILYFAVEVDLAGISIDTVGVILMVVGVIGALLTLLVWGPRRRARETYVDRPVDREVIRERDGF